MFGSWLSKIKTMRAYVSGDLSAAIKHAQKRLTKNNRDIGAHLPNAFDSKESMKKRLRMGEKPPGYPM
jgi:hypothetical protein